MLNPSFLKLGDKIGIIAPSRKITPDVLYPCIKLFESWGLQVVLSPNIYSENHQLAGTDLERRTDLESMLNNPQIKAIMCARGGYGTVRILEGLQYSGFSVSPKWIIGYSDITVLHSFAQTHLKCSTIHATMPINYNPADGETESWKSLKNLLFGEPIDYRIKPDKLNKSGKATGKLIGGNLSVLYSLSGTPYDIDTKDAILFLEDLDEYLYHIDRMMMNLKLSGKLNNLKGMVVGGMSDMKDNTIPFGKDANEIISEHLNNYDFPVIFNFPAGHLVPNLPLLFGKEVELNVGADDVTLKYI